MDWLTTVKNSNLISQHIHIPKHNVVHPKLTQYYRSNLSEAGGEKKRRRSHLLKLNQFHWEHIL